MPNRDHDDTPYNRSEGRFENQYNDRDEERSPYQREQSYRSSRDWDRRDDFRAGTPYRSYAEGYNPARDENDYRGGSRFEERHRQGGSYDTRNWDDDARWRERLRSSSGQGNFGQGNYGQGYRQPGYSQSNYGQGNFGRDNIGQFGARSPFGGTSEYGSYGGHDWNRDYTRDWDRDYRGDADRRSNYANYTRSQDEGDFGDQLRHAGRQVISKVKRAFRGPKGYKRSDERVREDVNDRLALQDELDPSDIEVRVENGEVTLTGTVRSRHEKFRAEEIADDVSGVSDVHNQLRVGSAQAQVQTGTTPSATTNTPISRNGRA
ncbi:MAG TPA: BON domain-containing protein [Polyangiales bacterium]|nr:BON domain-containing protein [Polyangiales bacterium]